MGGLDILQRQRIAQEELRGELGAGHEEIRQGTAEMMRPLLEGVLEQRERNQLLDAQHAQLVERFDLHADDFALGRQYADAMEQAETERLEREARREAETGEAIQRLDKRSQNLVDEIRAAQEAQGSAGERRQRDAEQRLNSKIDALGRQIGDAEARRQLDQAFQQVARGEQVVRTPRRVSPTPELDALRSESPTFGRRPRSETKVRPKTASPTMRRVGGGYREVTSPQRSPERAGWKSGPAVQDRVQPEPQVEFLRSKPPPSEPPRTALGEGMFDWDATRGKAKGVDRGKSVGADEKSLEAEDTKPQRQLLTERLASGLEESPETPEGFEPHPETPQETGVGGSELLEQEAEQAHESELEKLRKEPSPKKKSSPLEELREEPAETPEGGEGFRAGDVGREQEGAEEAKDE